MLRFEAMRFIRTLVMCVWFRRCQLKLHLAMTVHRGHTFENTKNSNMRAVAAWA
jgi:hypothetical protein